MLRMLGVTDRRTDDSIMPIAGHAACNTIG